MTEEGTLKDEVRKINENIEKLTSSGKVKGFKPNKKLTNSDLNPIEKDYFKKLHRTIKKVTDDILRFNFNTAISAIMELINIMYKYNDEVKPRDLNYDLIYEATEKAILLISPIAPFISEELWCRLGKKFSVHNVSWPDHEIEIIKEEMAVIVFQINGKIRDKKEFPVNTPEKDVENFAFSSEKIKNYIEGKKIIKKIYVQDKLFSMVVA